MVTAARIWWNWHGCSGFTEHSLDLRNSHDDESDAEFLDGQIWWWTEGNFGCDCNRSDVIGLPIEIGCGDSIIFEYVMLYRGGRHIGTFWDDIYSRE